MEAPKSEGDIYNELISATDPLHADIASPLFHHGDILKDPYEVFLNYCIALASCPQLLSLEVHLDTRMISIPKPLLHEDRINLPLEGFGMAPVTRVEESCILFELEVPGSSYEIAIPVNYFTEPRKYKDTPISGRVVKKFAENYPKANIVSAEKLVGWVQPQLLPVGFFGKLTNLPATTLDFLDIMKADRE